MLYVWRHHWNEKKAKNISFSLFDISNKISFFFTFRLILRHDLSMDFFNSDKTNQTTWLVNWYWLWLNCIYYLFIFFVKINNIDILRQRRATLGPRPHPARKGQFLSFFLGLIFGPRDTNWGAMWPADKCSCPTLL